MKLWLIVLIAVLTVSSIMVWGIFSFLLLRDGNHEFFQRLGSFGVFSWVLLLAQTRISVEKQESDRHRELERQIEKFEAEKRMLGKASEYRSSSVAWQREKEKFTWRQRYLVAGFEIVFIGLATLQWGYGDLLVIAVHGLDR